MLPLKQDIIFPQDQSVNVKNNLPELIVEVQSVDTFKNLLDQYYSIANQMFVYNF